MRLSSGVWLLLIVIGVVARAQSSVAEPRYRERVEHFDISGHVNSRRDMWQAIWDWGPSKSLGSSIVGQAQPRIGYSYKLRQKGGKCTFSNLQVSVAVKLRLPAWDMKDFAKSDLQDYFSCILRTVTVHEKQHAQIAYEAGEKIEVAFQSRLSGSRCKGFPERAKNVYHEVLAEHKRRQNDFDRQDYARKRYQACNAGGRGPQADLSSKPRRSRFAARVPTKRFDEPAEQAESVRGRSAVTAPVAARSRATGEPGGEGGQAFALETTTRLVSSAGVVLVAAASVFGLFAAFMWGASSYEKRRELEGFPGNGEADPEAQGLPAGKPASRKPAAGRAAKPTGFGKRGRG